MQSTGAVQSRFASALSAARCGAFAFVASEIGGRTAPQ
jgi:hypothetical protein